MTVFFISQTRNTHMRTTHCSLGHARFVYVKYAHAHNPWPWSSSSFPRREIHSRTQPTALVVFFISQTRNTHNPWPCSSCWYHVEKYIHARNPWRFSSLPRQEIHMHTTHCSLGHARSVYVKYAHAHNPWPWSSSSFPRQEIHTRTQLVFFVSQTRNTHNPWPCSSCWSSC